MKKGLGARFEKGLGARFEKGLGARFEKGLRARFEKGLGAPQLEGWRTRNLKNTTLYKKISTIQFNITEFCVKKMRILGLRPKGGPFGRRRISTLFMFPGSKKDWEPGLKKEWEPVEPGARIWPDLTRDPGQMYEFGMRSWPDA